MATTRALPRRSSEEGTVLIIVLVFMVAIGVIVAASFANAGANFRNTVGVRANGQKAYAADSGMDWAIKRVRADNSLCPTVGSYEGTALGAIPKGPAINGNQPEFKCTVSSGSVTGVNGFAIITTSPTSGALDTSGSQVKTVNGPIWASDIANNIQKIVVTTGGVWEDKAQGCTTKPAGMTIDPPFTYTCTTDTNPASLVPHVLPTSGIQSAAKMPATGNGRDDCRVFKPGRYADANGFVLAKDNYLVSGVYYLDNVGLIDVTKLQLVGGAAHADEEADRIPGVVPCSTDAANGGASPAGSTGVKIILGGNSRIIVGNPSGRLELFSRFGGAANEGTQGISLQTVCDAAATLPGAKCDAANGTWPGEQSTLGLAAGDALLDSGNNGETVLLRVHGQVYAPNALLSFNATNDSNAWLLGGVVIGKIVLRQQATTGAVKVSVVQGIGARTMTIESTVKLNGERRVRSIATLSIKNDVARTLDLKTWRTDCQDSSGNSCSNV